MVSVVAWPMVRRCSLYRRDVISLLVAPRTNYSRFEEKFCGQNVIAVIM